MAEKEIALLQEQIDRLSEKRFDLEAWKDRTTIFLERIFGKDSSKIKMIKELGYDYSSWSLRDTAAAGKTKDKDPVKLQAEEILLATIAELQALGLPEKTKEKEAIWELLKEELTGKQIREIEALAKSEDKDKTDKISEVLEKMGIENLAGTVAKLLIT